MTFEIAAYCFLLAALLAASGFFSGSETAFFALNHIEKQKLSHATAGKTRGFVRSVLASPSQILITILTGNMVVNFLFASLTDRVVDYFIHTHAAIYSILVGTFLLLVFGEMAPKYIAIRHSLPFFSFTSRPLFYVHAALRPVRKGIKVLEGGIVRFVTMRIRLESEAARTRIISTARFGLNRGVIHRSELAVLESFLALREKTAGEIMTPRIDLNALDATTTTGDLLAWIAAEREQELIPVYRDDIDHVVGYVDVQDMLPIRFELQPCSNVAQVMQAIHAVPDGKPVLDLMREMMAANKKMAVVVDEYGGTAGVVTHESILKDLLSFFYPADASEYVKIAEGAYRVSGQFEIEHLGKLLDAELDSEARTVGGLVIERLGDIPSVGAEVIVSGHVFAVRRISKNRISEVEVRRQ